MPPYGSAGQGVIFHCLSRTTSTAGPPTRRRRRDPCRPAAPRHSPRRARRAASARSARAAVLHRVAAGQGACRATDMTSHSNDKQLACTLAAGEGQKTWFAGLRRGSSRAASPMPSSSTPTPARSLPRAGRARRHQPMVGGGRRGKRLSDRVPGCDERPGLQREPLPCCEHRSRHQPGSISASAPLGACPNPALLCARPSPATARSASSSSGPTRPARPSSRSKRLAPRCCRPTGGELSRHRWEELCEPRRLDFAVDELSCAHHRAQRHWGGRFDADELRAFLQRVNEQEEQFEVVRQRSSPRQVPRARHRGQITNVMSTQCPPWQ